MFKVKGVKGLGYLRFREFKGYGIRCLGCSRFKEFMGLGYKRFRVFKV